mmetsp:Transcript_22231/g.64564  ORF Transcript_22231/g.64564 Transcript_22231/m.64564 type:complete len:211 (-) Transcript_22231:436-1068(-)
MPLPLELLSTLPLRLSLHPLEVPSVRGRVHIQPAPGRCTAARARGSSGALQVRSQIVNVGIIRVGVAVVLVLATSSFAVLVLLIGGWVLLRVFQRRLLLVPNHARPGLVVLVVGVRGLVVLAGIPKLVLFAALARGCELFNGAGLIPAPQGTDFLDGQPHVQENLLALLVRQSPEVEVRVPRELLLGCAAAGLGRLRCGVGEERKAFASA